MMENDCQSFREQILDFIAGTLPAGRIAELEHHISQCPACRKYLEDLQADDKLLGDFADAMRPKLAQLENDVIDVLEREPSKKPVSFISIWRRISRRPITKLAAAAVIIVAIGFFVVHRGPNQQINGRSISEVSKSPAELLTAMSLNIAYRKGGMEAVERQCKQALKLVELRPEILTVQQLLAELINNDELERTKL